MAYEKSFGIWGSQLPIEKINLQIQDPECQDKPNINQISKILAQSKRTNEPIHERLYKQEIMCKKIAQEIDKEYENGTININVIPERCKSRQEKSNSKLQLVR